MNVKEKYYKAIMEQCGCTRKEIDELVKGKREELKGLISEEGALFVISKEYGIELTSIKKIKNGGNTKMSEENNYLIELSKLDVGGNYVPSADGLIVTFKLVDHTKKYTEVEKTYEGKKNVKHQWAVVVHGISFNKKAYREILTDSEEGIKKLKRIDEFEKGNESVLELSRTASKQLGVFMLENKITSEHLIKYLRTGTGGKTQYAFKKIGKTEGD